MHRRQAPCQLNSTPVLNLLANSVWVLAPSVPHYKTDQFSNAVPCLYFCWGYLRPGVHPSHSRKKIPTPEHLRQKRAKEAAHCLLRGGRAKRSFLCGPSLLRRTTCDTTIQMSSSFTGLEDSIPSAIWSLSEIPEPWAIVFHLSIREHVIFSQG